MTDKCAPYNISESLGSSRFLVLLREPLAKAVSLWNHHYGFEEHHPFLGSPNLNYYLNEAKYHNFIETWFKYFDPIKFLFIKSEDLFKRPNTVFRKICLFLHIKFIRIQERKDNVKDSIITREIQEKFNNYFDETKKEVMKLTGLSW